MGLLRTLLAISVVFAHSYGFVFVGGKIAVQLFYMISGFLISFVLVEKRTYTTVKNFYFNRYLRLFPVYAVTAAATLLYFWRINYSPFFSTYQTSPLSATLILITSNIFIFFQDWVIFLDFKDGAYNIVSSLAQSSTKFYEGLLLPQAWTLGVELSFYLIAPFILLNRKLLIALLIGSLALRVYLLSIGIGAEDPWSYRFFPTELTLFLAGAMSHQLLLPLYQKYLLGNIKKLSNYATWGLFTLFTLYFIIPVENEGLKTIALLLTFFVLMPLTFIYQKHSKIDRWIGELSYPIYAIHILIILVASHQRYRFGEIDQLFFSIACVSLSIIASIALTKLVSDPVEKFREARRK